ncbi:hypothetical protein LguiB_013648 [Lonicera macranthoides]
MLKITPLDAGYYTWDTIAGGFSEESSARSSSTSRPDSPSPWIRIVVIIGTRTGPTISGGQTNKAYEEVFEASAREAELFKPSFFHEGRAMTVMDLTLTSVSLAYNHLGDAMLPGD